MLIKLEEEVINFYNEAATKTENPEIKKTLESLSKESMEHKTLLIKTSRETVTEMTLEPVTGLNLEEKLNLLKKELREGKEDIKTKLVKVEETIKEIYLETSKKIMYISGDTSYLLERFAKQCNEKIMEIKKMGK